MLLQAESLGWSTGENRGQATAANVGLASHPMIVLETEKTTVSSALRRSLSLM